MVFNALHEGKGVCFTSSIKFGFRMWIGYKNRRKCVRGCCERATTHHGYDDENYVGLSAGDMDFGM